MDETQPTQSPEAATLPSSDRAVRIREQAFPRKMFGYDPDQVRGFLVAVAEWYEDLDRETAGLRMTSERIRMETAGAVHRELAEAQAEAKRVRVEARDEAARLRVQAEGQADRLRGQAERDLQIARETAARERHDAATLREVLQQDLAEIRSTVAALARRLREHGERLEATATGEAEEAPAPSAETPAAAEPGAPAGEAPAGEIMVLPEVTEERPER